MFYYRYSICLVGKAKPVLVAQYVKGHFGKQALNDVTKLGVRYESDKPERVEFKDFPYSPPLAADWKEKNSKEKYMTTSSNEKFDKPLCVQMKFYQAGGISLRIPLAH